MIRRPAPPPAVPATDLVRLNKRMAELGLCSRREADDFLQRGLVTVDGQRAVLGQKVRADADVRLDAAADRHQADQVTVLLNKPIGFVSGQPEHGYEPAIVLIIEANRDRRWPGPPLRSEHFKGLAVAGRLDIDSKGLLVFTQDGRVAKQLVGADHDVDKEYLVRVEGQLSPAGLQRLRHGLVFDDRPLLPCEVVWQNADQLRFVLREGRKRQIRRMCEAVGLHVVGLKRVRVGGVMLGGLEEGRWRFLQEGERF